MVIPVAPLTQLISLYIQDYRIQNYSCFPKNKKGF